MTVFPVVAFLRLLLSVTVRPFFKKKSTFVKAANPAWAKNYGSYKKSVSSLFPPNSDKTNKKIFDPENFLIFRFVFNLECHYSAKSFEKKSAKSLVDKSLSPRQNSSEF